MASPTTIVTVTCSLCADRFDVSDHTERGYRRTGRLPVCHACRHPPPKPREADRRYWLDRFTLPEIIEIAEGMFGPREFWRSTRRE